MKTEEIKQIKTELETLIAKNDYDNPQPASNWLSNADKINALLMSLTPIMIAVEQRYSQDIKDLESKFDYSNARAKAEAKTLDSYRRFKIYESLVKRGDEKIKIAKKMAQISHEEQFKQN